MTPLLEDEDDKEIIGDLIRALLEALDVEFRCIGSTTLRCPAVAKGVEPDQCFYIAHVSRQSVNELLRERRAVSPEMAICLARLFGNSAEFWLNAQRAVDLWEAKQALASEVARIRPLNAA